jgi:hypothetical protein
LASSLRLRFQEFEAVAPRIFGEKAASVGEGGVIDDFDPVSEQCLSQFVEIAGSEGGVSFLCRPKVFFYADVELLAAALEPTTAARTERLGLFQFWQAE